MNFPDLYIEKKLKEHEHIKRKATLFLYVDGGDSICQSYAVESMKKFADALIEIKNLRIVMDRAKDVIYLLKIGDNYHVGDSLLELQDSINVVEKEYEKQ
jgi:hypothetical protein